MVHNLRKPTLQAAYKVIYHLKSSLWKGLTIQKYDTLTLEAYTNADYVGSPIDMRPPMWCDIVLSLRLPNLMENQEEKHGGKVVCRIRI